MIPFTQDVMQAFTQAKGQFEFRFIFLLNILTQANFEHRMPAAYRNVSLDPIFIK